MSIFQQACSGTFIMIHNYGDPVCNCALSAAALDLRRERGLGIMPMCRGHPRHFLAARRPVREREICHLAPRRDSPNYAENLATRGFRRLMWRLRMY